MFVTRSFTLGQKVRNNKKHLNSLDLSSMCAAPAPAYQQRQQRNMMKAAAVAAALVGTAVAQEIVVQVCHWTAPSIQIVGRAQTRTDKHKHAQKTHKNA